MAAATRSTLHGWELYDHGPQDARQTALLLPGGLCSGIFYDEVAAEPALGDVRMVATTIPGYAGTEPAADLGIESCAAGAARLADELGVDVVVGHSVGANVAIEMVAGGAFSGPVVLLAPSFSREDEAKPLRALDKLTAVLGHRPYALVLKGMGVMLKGEVPPDRVGPLAAELKRNDPRVVRRAVHDYLGYLDRHGSVAPRLCDAGVPAWVVFGDKDDVGMADAERAQLEACPHVTLETIAGAGHMTLNSHPDRVAALIAEAIAAARPVAPERSTS